VPDDYPDLGRKGGASSTQAVTDGSLDLILNPGSLTSDVHLTATVTGGSVTLQNEDGQYDIGDTVKLNLSSSDGNYPLTTLTIYFGCGAAGEGAMFITGMDTYKAYCVITEPHATCTRWRTLKRAVSRRPPCET
jgi:hypothetical protein